MTTTPSLDELLSIEAKTGHSVRFRKVSNGYPHQVALAYDHDLYRAAADSDEQVAATVAAWSRRTESRSTTGGP